MSNEKNKGSYHERWWVNLFKSWGWSAKRQPLSGALKDYPSDIDLSVKIFGDSNYITSIQLLCESKYRHNGFALISKYLGKKNNNYDNDLLLLKQKNGEAFMCFNVKNTKVLHLVRFQTEENEN
tara:strand:+ start:755 stop:1126 length:372 start_codon:yes stop_codon:yes gene_type:complete